MPVGGLFHSTWGERTRSAASARFTSTKIECRGTLPSPRATSTALVDGGDGEDRGGGRTEPVESAYRLDDLGRQSGQTWGKVPACEIESYVDIGRLC